MDIAKLKAKAKKTLSKNLKPFVLATLTIMMLGVICFCISNLISTKWLYSLLALIVDALFFPGLIKMTLKAARNEKVKLDDLFSETELFFKYIGVFLVLFIMLFILGVLEAIALRSLMAIMFFNAEISLMLSIFLIAFGLLLAVAIMLVTIYILVSFSQVFFVLVDEPKLSITEILVKSFDMMENYVIEYFYLLVSFIGWMLLGLCTLGIAYILVIPYILISMAYFYERVKQDYSNYGTQNADLDADDEFTPIFTSEDTLKTSTTKAVKKPATKAAKKPATKAAPKKTTAKTTKKATTKATTKTADKKIASKSSKATSKTTSAPKKAAAKKTVTKKSTK